MALKKSLIFLFLLSGISYAQMPPQQMVTQGSPMLSQDNDPSEQIIGPFGTLNNRDNPAAIPSNYAQDLLNVDITPGGKSFKKRKGYGLSYALTIATSPVHGTYDFFDSNGNDIALAFQDIYMTASISGAAPVVLFSTGTNGVTYQCTDSQGFAYCVNTRRDAPLKTNGVTNSYLAPTSNGTMIAVTPDRLVLSGFASRPNDIDFSASLDFTNWTVSVQNTSPYTFTITAPGSSVKMICYAFNRIMWFKDSSFGYILPGQTAADWVQRTISPVVGTLDNSYVYWEGVLYWRGQDGHIYSYDGSNLQKISREIQGTISLCQKKTSNSWTQKTTSDFNTGYSDNTFYIDTTSVSNQIKMTFPETFTTYRNGTNGTKTVWTDYQTTGGVAPSITANGLKLSVTGGFSGDSFVRTAQALNTFSVGTTYSMYLSAMNFSASAGHSIFTVTLSSFATTTQGPSSNINYFFFQFGSTATGTFFLQNVKSSSDLYLCSNNGLGGPTCQVTASNTPSVISIILSTTNWGVYENATKIISGTHTFPNYAPYLYMDYFWADFGTAEADVSSFAVLPCTATWSSAVHNAPNLTSWDTFSVTDSLSSTGNETFSLRSSTSSFTVNSSTPAWTIQSAGSVPSISTGTFFQVKDFFSLSLRGDIPTLNSFTVNWFEGNATDKSYATYYNDAIWFSVAYGAGATSNNRILKYDLLNKGWLIYDIPVNGFYLRYLNLYFGSSGSGNVYKYGDTDDDAGSAINAYWQSKDFIGNSPFQNEELRNISIFYSVQNSTANVTYTTNGSSSTTYSVWMYGSPSQGFNNSNRVIPSGVVANAFNLKVGNNAADQPFEIFAERLGTNPKPWVPTAAGQ